MKTDSLSPANVIFCGSSPTSLHKGLSYYFQLIGPRTESSVMSCSPQIGPGPYRRPLETSPKGEMRSDCGQNEGAKCDFLYSIKTIPKSYSSQCSSHVFL